MLALGRNWWVPALRGSAAVIFGILCMVWPGLALATLVALFGVYALADGIIALAGLFGHRTDQTPWWLQLLAGAAGLIAGIWAFSAPALTAVTLLTLIAVYACVVGISHFVSAIQQKGKPGAVGLGISGAALALLGILMLARPMVGALAVAWLIGVFAIASGVGSLMLAQALYQLKERGPQLAATMVPERRERVEK